MVARLALPERFQLRSVLGPLQRGRSDPCMRLWDRGCWRATRTPDGPVTLALNLTGSCVDAEAWGPGAEWAVEHVPDLLGLHDDPSVFRPPPGLVRDVLRELGTEAIRIGRSLAVAEAVAPTVIEQRVTSGAALRSWRTLVYKLGERAPGPLDGLRLPPTPERLAATPSWVFHRAGIERGRAETITAAMRRSCRLEETTAMSLTDAHERLQSFRGIGVWSSNEVALRALGDADAVSVGDFHLKNLVAFALAGEPRATDERMLELLEPFRGNRARAVHLIAQAGVSAPRYGPKVAVPAIASL